MIQSKKQLKDLLKTFKRDYFTASMETLFLSLIKETSASFFKDNFLISEQQTQRQKDSRFTLNINLVRFLDKSEMALKAVEEITGKDLLTDILLTTTAGYIYSNVKFYLIENNLPCIEKKWQYSPLTQSLDTGLFVKNQHKTFGDLVLQNIISGSELDRIFQSIYNNSDFCILKEQTKTFIELSRKKHLDEIHPVDLNGVSLMFMGDWKNDVYTSKRSSIDPVKMDSITFFINEFLPYSVSNYAYPLNTILPYLLYAIENNKEYINQREYSVVEELLNVKLNVGNYDWLNNLLKDPELKKVSSDFCALNNNNALVNLNKLLCTTTDLKSYLNKEQLTGSSEVQEDYIKELYKKDLSEQAVFLDYVNLHYQKDNNSVHFNMLIEFISKYTGSLVGNENKEKSSFTINDFCRNIDRYFYEQIKETRYWIQLKMKYKFDEKEIITILSAKEEKKALDNILKEKPVYQQKIVRL